MDQHRVLARPARQAHARRGENRSVASPPIPAAPHASRSSQAAPHRRQHPLLRRRKKAFTTRMLASPSTISIAPAAGRRSARASNCGPAATTFTGAKVTAEEIGDNLACSSSCRPPTPDRAMPTTYSHSHRVAPRLPTLLRRPPNSQQRSPLCGLRTTVACDNRSEANLHRRRHASRHLSPCRPPPRPPSISNGRHHLNTRAKFVCDAAATVTIDRRHRASALVGTDPLLLNQTDPLSAHG